MPPRVGACFLWPKISVLSGKTLAKTTGVRYNTASCDPKSLRFTHSCYGRSSTGLGVLVGRKEQLYPLHKTKTQRHEGLNPVDPDGQ